MRKPRRKNDAALQAKIAPEAPRERATVTDVAVIDWFSRAVLAWRLSNTMGTAFCEEALGEALARFSRPEIFETDQGRQFTGAAFTGRRAGAGIRVSMDGRGRWLDQACSSNDCGAR